MGKDRNRSRLFYWFGSKFYVPLSAILLILSFGVCSLAYATVVSKSFASNEQTEKSLVQQKVMNLQIPFVANQGQIKNKNIRYHASTMGGSVYIGREGYLTYRFSQIKTSTNQLLVERLINASNLEPVGISPSSAKVNYIKGNDDKTWKKGIRTYNALAFGEVYPGIELNLTAHGRTVEKIFTIHPGVDPQNIQLSLQGARSLGINKSGELEALIGARIIKFSRPIAFQMIAGKKNSVQVAYLLDGDRYGFELGDYDKSHVLVIDPCVFFEKTIGGSDEDVANAIDIDETGNIYIAGTTFSYDVDDNPEYGISLPGYSGSADVFVTKLVSNPDYPDIIEAEPYQIEFTTYFGGIEDDFGNGMVVHSTGIYLTGTTMSPDLPTQSTSPPWSGYDTKIGGGQDAWIAKLGTDGVLKYSSYFGGGGADSGQAIALFEDANGVHAYIAGETLSSSFPVTPNVAFAKSKGNVDAFVTRFFFKLLDGSVEFGPSTYLGGNGADVGYAIAIDDSAVYVAGQTSSVDFWTSNSGPLNGPSDAFLTVLYHDLNEPVIYSSFIGDIGEDGARAIVLDKIYQTVLLTGFTSGSFGRDVFLAKVDPNPNDGLYDFVPLGSSDAIGYGIEIDDNSNIYVVGETKTPELLSSEAAGSYFGGSDAFVLKIDSDYTMEYAHYIGDEFDDEGKGIALDYLGNVYATGSIEVNGGLDAFVATIAELDSDRDGLPDPCDNCPFVANYGGVSGTCSIPDDVVVDSAGNIISKTYIPCTSDSDCTDLGYCSMSQDNSEREGSEIDDLGDACDDDDDGDLMPDWWEVQYSRLDPYSNDANEHYDTDGLTNLEEYLNRHIFDDSTNPVDPDTDEDGWTDLQEKQAEEVLGGVVDPTNPDKYPTSEIFKDGIYVDPDYVDDSQDPTIVASDKNLGTQYYPLKTIHAAIDRLNLLEPGIFQFKIYIAAGTYSLENEPNRPLKIEQDVTIEGPNVILKGSTPSSWDVNDPIQWRTGLIFFKATCVTIKGIKIEGFDKGIVINSDGGSFDLLGVQITPSAQGAALSLVDTYQLKINFDDLSKISGGEIGIAFEPESSDNIVDNVAIENTRFGIVVNGGTGNIVSSPQIVGKYDFSSPYGVVLNPGVDDFTITGGSIQKFASGIGFKTDAACLKLLGTTIGSTTGNEGAGNLVGIEITENYMLNIDLTGSFINDNDIGILFTAGSSSNVIRNGAVTNNGEGVRFEACNGVGEAPEDNKLLGTTFSGNADYGIVMMAGSGNQVKAWGDDEDENQLSITGSNIGVYIAENSQGNTIRGYRIFLNDSENITLEGSGNTFEDVFIEAAGLQSGISDFYGTDNSFIDSTLKGTNEEGIYGLLVEPGNSKVALDNVTIIDFDIGVGFATDAACISMTNSMIQCSQDENCETGVLLAENYMLDIDLDNTTISGFETGIKFVGGSSSNTIRKGDVTSNLGDGIQFDGCNAFPDDNKIIGTWVYDNTRNGIAIFAGSGNEIIDSKVYNNNGGNNSSALKTGLGGIAILNGGASVKYSEISINGCAGIYADEASPVEIIGNVIHKNDEGVRLSFTSDVLVRSNTIAGNLTGGLFIEPGSTPDIHYNILWGNNGQDIEIEDAFYTVEYDSLKYNAIGSINLPWLPPNNFIGVAPLFIESGENPYELQPGSPMIDASDVTEGGRDFKGVPRPLGGTWDIGAFEVPINGDTDGDGLPDEWEEEYVKLTFPGEPPADFLEILDPNGDYDGDGLSNWEEFLRGQNPFSPISLEVTNPSESPYYTTGNTIQLSGFVIGIDGNDGNEYIVRLNGASGITVPDDGSWDFYDIGLDSNLDAEEFRISVHESDGQTEVALVSQTITIVHNDLINPIVNINYPVPFETYTTAIGSMTVRGAANDNTIINDVTMDLYVFDETIGVNGDWRLAVSPTVVDKSTIGVSKEWSTWEAGFSFVEHGQYRVEIIATDFFDNTATDTLYVLYTDENTTYTETDESLELDVDDPLDTDKDGYLNADEFLCGSDPDDPGDPNPAIPSALDDPLYPSDPGDPNYNANKIGYTIPDCLNDDDDADGLPDWWEEKYYDEITTPTLSRTTWAQPVCDDLNPEPLLCNPDGDDFSNRAEFENETSPWLPQIDAFTLILLDESDMDKDISETYLPDFTTPWDAQGGQQRIVKVKAVWKTQTDVAEPTSVNFSLKSTSQYPGRAVNDPDPSKMLTHSYPSWYQYDGFDFGLTTAPATDHSFDQGPVPRPKDNVSDAFIVYLQCWDYGGRTKVVVKHASHPDYIGQMWVPKGSADNGIGDYWETDINEGAQSQLNPTADIDAIDFGDENSELYTAPLGDDFNNFEEYRGIIFTAPNEEGLIVRHHERLNPNRKDLFVRGVGYTLDSADMIGLAYDNAGIDLWNVTDWGHDATGDLNTPLEPGPFFMYIQQGTIESIKGYDNKEVDAELADWKTKWPENEWEFRLDDDDSEDAWTPIASWGDPDAGDGAITNTFQLGMPYQGCQSCSGEYKIRRPLPHMNVLIVRNDKNTLSMFPGWDDGRIKFMGASPPSNLNPDGARFWTWSTKGYTRTVPTLNRDTWYGLAFTLEKPLDNYFYDRPYYDGNDNDILDPLADSTFLDDQALTGNPDNYNGDGDFRIADKAYWRPDPNVQQRSPFDIDGNGSVELPVVSHIGDAQEYTYEQVLKHTITHEIGHALGGPSHTSDPECLMYKYSNNWSRDGNFSLYYRSLLRIHNKIR